MGEGESRSPGDFRTRLWWYVLLIPGKMSPPPYQNERYTFQRVSCNWNRLGGHVFVALNSYGITTPAKDFDFLERQLFHVWFPWYPIYVAHALFSYTYIGNRKDGVLDSHQWRHIWGLGRRQVEPGGRVIQGQSTSSLAALWSRRQTGHAQFATYDYHGEPRLVEYSLRKVDVLTAITIVRSRF